MVVELHDHTHARFTMTRTTDTPLRGRLTEFHLFSGRVVIVVVVVDA